MHEKVSQIKYIMQTYIMIGNQVVPGKAELMIPVMPETHGQKEEPSLSTDSVCTFWGRGCVDT